MLLPNSRVEKPDCRLYFYSRGWAVILFIIMQDRKKTDLKTSSSGMTHIICGLIILVAVITAGTVGYMVIEKWRFLDALYMTIITITTVGFKEVGKVSDTGRIFTLVLIFMGMGIIGYTLGTSAQVMVEFQLRNLFGRRKLSNKIKKLKEHYIICGYDRIGKVIVDELLHKKIPMVVIDKDPDVERDLNDLNVPYIIWCLPFPQMRTICLLL